MAKPSDLGDEVVRALSSVPKPSHRNRAKELRAARRTEALTLRLAGMSFEQIGERLGISKNGAIDMVGRTMGRAENLLADQQRELENARLDRAQVAIWSRVLQGDDKAIGTFLRISSQRARMNGLNAPIKLAVSVEIRADMEQALADLEALVASGGRDSMLPDEHEALGWTEDGEVVEDDDEADFAG